MKNLLFLLLLFASIQNIICQHTFNTNIRIAQSDDEKNLVEVNYDITMVGDTLNFKCSCEVSFQMILDEFAETLSDGEYQIDLWSTVEDDDLSFTYYKGDLISIVIHQVNGVDLIYMFSPALQKKENKVYRL